jgi:hypothetical protein
LVLGKSQPPPPPREQRTTNNERRTTNDEIAFLEEYMHAYSKAHSKFKPLLVLVLAVSVATPACSPNWINIALQDLPVLTQMALNVATLANMGSQQQNSADLAVIQNISGQVSRDLNLLQTLYNEYKASPNDTRLKEIQSAVELVNLHLPALLESAHISNAPLKARVTAAVNLILTTVNNFAALIPLRAKAKPRRAVVSLPRATDLKREWNEKVCTPDPAIASPSVCMMR